MHLGRAWLGCGYLYGTRVLVELVTTENRTNAQINACIQNMYMYVHVVVVLSLLLFERKKVSFSRSEKSKFDPACHQGSVDLGSAGWLSV